MQSNFLSNGSSGWVSKKFQVRWMGLEIQIDSSSQNVWCDQMQIMFDHVLHQAHPTIQSLEDGVLHRSAAHWSNYTMEWILLNQRSERLKGGDFCGSKWWAETSLAKLSTESFVQVAPPSEYKRDDILKSCPASLDFPEYLGIISWTKLGEDYSPPALNPVCVIFHSASHARKQFWNETFSHILKQDLKGA